MADALPKFRRPILPGLLPLFGAGEFSPGEVVSFSCNLGFIEEDGMKNPTKEKDTDPNSPGDTPRFFPCTHSGPQMDLICATPLLTCSGVSEGLNSKTFR